MSLHAGDWERGMKKRDVICSEYDKLSSMTFDCLKASIRPYASAENVRLRF